MRDPVRGTVGQDTEEVSGKVQKWRHEVIQESLEAEGAPSGSSRRHSNSPLADFNKEDSEEVGQDSEAEEMEEDMDTDDEVTVINFDVELWINFKWIEWKINDKQFPRMQWSSESYEEMEISDKFDENWNRKN